MPRKRKTPTIWQALNEPVVEVSEGFARNLLIAAILLLLVAWVGSYWGGDRAGLPYTTYRSSALIEAQTLPSQVSFFRLGSMVAGVQTTGTPLWYEVAKDLPGDVAFTFTAAAYEVLDISEPVGQIAEFYEPGFTAVGDAWLELMADPY